MYVCIYVCIYVYTHTYIYIWHHFQSTKIENFKRLTIVKDVESWELHTLQVGLQMMQSFLKNSLAVS